MRTHSPILLALALVPLTACELGIGSVQVFIEAEDTIPEGLEPGDGDEQVVDGWTVRYDKFLVVVGGFTAARSDDGNDVLVGPDPQIVSKLMSCSAFVARRNPSSACTTEISVSPPCGEASSSQRRNSTIAAPSRRCASRVAAISAAFLQAFGRRQGSSPH